MKIIFVCTGNTCRSPMAAGYLSSKKIPDLEVLSRGIFADGSPVSKNSVSVMAEMGINIKGHISAGISDKDLNADLFIPMSASHKAALMRLGIDEKKILSFENEIPDPFLGNETVYRFCRNKIIDETDSLLFGGKILPFTVENVKETDFEALAELERECFSSPWSEEGLLESFFAGTKFFVCRHGGAVIGYAGLSAVAGEGYITNIAVTEEYRRLGIGTLLINRLLSFAVKNSLEFLTLEVRTSNERAISLYEKFDFKTEGIRKNFYDFPKEDALIMTRRFNDVDFKY